MSFSSVLFSSCASLQLILTIFQLSKRLQRLECNYKSSWRVFSDQWPYKFISYKSLNHVTFSGKWKKKNIRASMLFWTKNHLENNDNCHKKRWRVGIIMDLYVHWTTPLKNLRMCLQTCFLSLLNVLKRHQLLPVYAIVCAI